MSNNMVRISVAALTPVVRCGWFKSSHVGIWLDKRKRWGAIGGAVELTAHGKVYLLSLGAEDFESGNDARFKIPREKLDTVYNFFLRRDPRFYEVSPVREVAEELFTPELHGQESAILPKFYQPGIRVRFKGTYVQPPTTPDQRRIFYLHDLYVESGAFELMKNSRHLRFLNGIPASMKFPP
jgi:hypothetical protein